MTLPIQKKGKEAQSRNMELTEQILLGALKKIRQVGYDSKITRAPETILECVKIAEAAILEAERAYSLQRPAGITAWVWYHFSFADLPHWQNCLIAAANAGASDVIESARKMYLSQSGEMCVTRKGRTPKSRKASLAEVGR